MNNNIIDYKLIGNENNIVFYTDEENNVNVEVILQDENVWLNIESLTKLFKIDRTGITRHINNIYKDEELEEDSTCAKIAHMGNNKQQYITKYYNLDMIISIGFRVNSKPAIKFRTWANKVIKEYMIKGFALNDDRFISGNRFDTRYFDELLERIKTITMNGWIEVADDLLKYRKKNVLKDAGKISHKQAVEKANKEYEKFRVKQDIEYISSMDKMLDKYLKENK